MRALIVESGFSNGQAMAESADPLGFPVRWLLREPMQNTVRIASVTSRILILHGQADVQIPVAQARELYAAAHDPKQLQLVASAGHEDVQKKMGLASYGALLRTFTNSAQP
jgi:fermentation-respiration switch protein FrsA (DUF1100 family)